MTETPAPDPMRRLSGGLLMAGGGLIALLCGSCTGMIWLSAIRGAMQGATVTTSAGGHTTVTHMPGHFEAFPVIVSGLVGGAPALGGLSAFLVGWRLAFRQGPEPPRRGSAVGRGLGLVIAAPSAIAAVGGTFGTFASQLKPGHGWDVFGAFFLALVGALGVLVGGQLFELSRRSPPE